MPIIPSHQRIEKFVLKLGFPGKLRFSINKFQLADFAVINIIVFTIIIIVAIKIMMIMMLTTRGVKAV